MAELGVFSSVLALTLVFFCGTSDVLWLVTVAQSTCPEPAPLVCVNGGSCQLIKVIDTSTFPFCACLPGYTGSTCETYVCQMSCLHGGVCITFQDAAGNQEACLCITGFTGQGCEKTETYVFFEGTSYSVPENRPGIALTVARSGDLNISSSVELETRALDATVGADYNDYSTVVTFEPDVSFKRVTIVINDDVISENSETFVVVLRNPVGGRLRYPDETAIVHILDDDATPFQVFPLQQTVRVSEAAGQVDIELLRSGGINRPINVNVSTRNVGVNVQPAQRGDYDALSNMELIFQPEMYSLMVPIVINDNSYQENSREFMVSYRIKQDGQMIKGNVSVIIEDDDNDFNNLPGFAVGQTYLYFTNLPYVTKEGDWQIEIPIYRLGNLNVSSKIEIYTTDGSARENEDYQPTHQTIQMNLGMTLIIFPILIYVDMELEQGDEVFYVSMNVLQGGILGRPDEQTVAVSIRSDVITPASITVKLTSVSYIAQEGQGSVAIDVVRQGGLGNQISVVVLTEGATAESSVDFIAIETVVIFPSQSDLQTVSIDIIDDDIVEPTESFHVVLGPVSLGTVVEPQRAEVLIIDNDGTATTAESYSTTAPSPAGFTIYIIIAAAVVIAFIVVIIVIVIVYSRCRRSRERIVDKIDVADIPLDTRIATNHSNSYLQHGSPIPVMRNRVAPLRDVDPDTKEYPRDKLRFYEDIGSGAFATVFRAEAIGIHRSGVVSTVAVKMLKETASESDKRDFMKELAVFKILGSHPNVMSMLGCCTTCEPLYLILEFMPHGNLQSYLQRIRTGKEKDHPGYLDATQRVIQPEDVLKFGSHILRGMEYLASKECIHRDLACRNILLAEDYICKVSDFGLAREVAEDQQYEMKSKGRVPVRWLAPECLLHNLYTSQSDVWSFGILMWELVTLGSHPYPGMSSQQVIRQVQQGYRLPKPEHCSQEIYDMMASCWTDDPEKRPTFQSLRLRIEAMLCDAQGYLCMEGFRKEDYLYMSPGHTSNDEDHALTDVKIDGQTKDKKVMPTSMNRLTP